MYGTLVLVSEHRHGERSISAFSTLLKNTYMYQPRNQETEEVQQLAMCLCIISRHQKGGVQGR
jgi:hypothetical protein